jgi:hypothetical protein
LWAEGLSAHRRPLVAAAERADGARADKDQAAGH